MYYIPSYSMPSIWAISIIILNDIWFLRIIIVQRTASCVRNISRILLDTEMAEMANISNSHKYTQHSNYFVL